VRGGMGNQERTHRVDKMDTEGNSKEGKLESWKEEGLEWGLKRGEKIMVLDRSRSEMVVNSCLEDLEKIMRLKRMWNLVPQVGEVKIKKGLLS